MKRNDYYSVQNKICQQPILTAAELSKQSEVLIDACEHPVDKGNVITNTLRNFRRSEELCGSGRKFQLSWKAKYNWIEYNVDKRRVFCSASGRSSGWIVLF
eukprot:Em0022g751a